MKLQNMISDGDKVQVYEVDGKAVKVFKDPNEPKSVVLYEALTHTRVEETGYNKIPALEEVTKIDGKWAISYDYITGDTLPPSGVNLTALLRRFMSIWFMRRLSP